MNEYDVIVHNDDFEISNGFIQKITMRVVADDKDVARLLGKAMAVMVWPRNKTAVEVEWRKTIE